MWRGICSGNSWKFWQAEREMQDSSETSRNSPAAADMVVRGKRVVTPEGERAAAIHVRGGVIAAVSGFDEIVPGAPVHEAGEFVVMPGVVDTHVHINEPGRSEWEGFSSATRAAAAGGVTTLIEMPLNSIPATISAAALREKLAATAGKLCVDTGFWGGVVPGNSEELEALWDAGVFGFKCFLVPSGVNEFAHVTEADLRVALPKLAALGAPLLAHAELPGPIEKAVADWRRVLRRGNMLLGLQRVRARRRTRPWRCWCGWARNLARGFTLCMCHRRMHWLCCAARRTLAAR
jgi:dihydroorotase-like cyclic amidohydrolase